VARLLAVGLAMAAMLTACPAHAQTPIVPDLSGKEVWFNWYDNQHRPLKLEFDQYGGALAIHGVDVYTGNFTGFLLSLRNDSATGAVTGQYLPSGLSYAITFTVCGEPLS
jgi:hypothetical protein